MLGCEKALLIADVQRATAELERSVGTRLVIPPYVRPLQDEMIAVSDPMGGNLPGQLLSRLPATRMHGDP